MDTGYSDIVLYWAAGMGGNLGQRQRQRLYTDRFVVKKRKH